MSGSGGKLKRSADAMPCDESHLSLSDYFMAKQTGKRCYIAAEMPQLDRTTTFVVGDNDTYLDFYNAPLEQGKQYGIWFSVAITVDGVSLVPWEKVESSVIVYFERCIGTMFCFIKWLVNEDS